MSLRLIDQKALHVLHAAERVKSVSWRPEHDCEVAIVPTTPGLSARPGSGSGISNTVSGADRIEIWDVRRPWLPKYVLEGGEGAVSRMSIRFASSNHKTDPVLLTFRHGVGWSGRSVGDILERDIRTARSPRSLSAFGWNIP